MNLTRAALKATTNLMLGKQRQAEEIRKRRKTEQKPKRPAR
jgi:hypothetical protein